MSEQKQQIGDRGWFGLGMVLVVALIVDGLLVDLEMIEWWLE